MSSPGASSWGPGGRGEAHAIPGRRPVAEALRAGRPLHEVLVDPRARVDRLADAARDAGVAVRRADRAEIKQVARGVVHQGVVARAPAFPYCRLETVAESDLVVMCDGVTDPQNLGAIARSAEVAGAGGLVLAQRRSVHVTPAAEKSAAGAFSWLPVALVPNLVRALDALAGQGFWSAGLDMGGPDMLWDSNLLDAQVVLVVGGEERGLGRLLAERVDGRVAIPMAGRVGSLNAGAAAAVALFEIARRRHVQQGVTARRGSQKSP